MKRQSIVGYTTLVIIIVSFVFLYWMRTRPPEVNAILESKCIPVTTYTVTEREIATYQNYSGKLQSGEEAKIIPQVLSKVVAIHVKEGDLVNIGDALMDLDTTTLNNQIQSASEGIEKLKSFNETLESGGEKLASILQDIDHQIADIESHLDRLEKEQSTMYAGTTYKKNMTALESELESLKMLKQTLTAITPNTTDSIDRLDALEDGYQMLIGMESQYHLTSPLNGRIVAVNAKTGEVPNFLAPSFIITGTENLKLSLAVPKEHLTYFQDVSPLIVEVFTLKGEPLNLEGRVEEVHNEPDAKTGLYAVNIVMPNPNLPLDTTSFGKVHIPLLTKSNACVIPKDAIMRTQNENYIYILSSTLPNTVEKRTVRIGIENDDEIEIIEGLIKGDIIILDGNAYLQDGDTVEVVSPLETHSSTTW
ncbi:efflux RND transporter periplasmic adaptor subunit [Niameybacter massiliensis]|uniref:Efflux RND transporter periplasmic adaptor subunit n=1 Tax=Holtiella tumoricola TaxID=3018743 RepID=A0AA42DMP2_9FIRM|nr:efflux RND transporter periplasmic adaptor subunit [Holtiella tumoricola]MDA3731607.1 efflux RND transporter periplasmic adaptor subunit [Holtiella tumoricola]